MGRPPVVVEVDLVTSTVRGLRADRTAMEAPVPNERAVSAVEHLVAQLRGPG